ncbi:MULTISPECIES: hypothetical protein [Clostridium]|uniref:hypothetical protein n=1 Tax=Clostridium TaxID=1485 RepID=UPI000825FFF3|nr:MULTISPECIES: hypothetical protein [Clostridium]PJI07038.1 hypothetical protein CUB90_03795 [Clostridium sp. CT7]
MENPTFQLRKWAKHDSNHELNSYFDDLSDYVIDFRISRRYGTNINELEITFNNIDHMFKPNPAGGVGDTDGLHHLIDNMDRIQLLINGVVEFTGFLTDYSTKADDKTAVGTVHDVSCLLKRGINLFPRPELKHSSMGAIEAIITAGGMVNVPINIDDRVKAKDYTISEVTFDCGTIAYDMISEICDSLGAQLICTKDGTVEIIPLYDGTIPSVLDFDYNDVDHVTSGDRKVQTSELYPSIWVYNSDDSSGISKGKMFRDKNMYDYLNQWDSCLKVNSKYALDQQTYCNIAYTKYMEMWRESTSGDAVTAYGNTSMDIGQIGKISYDDDASNYLVIGLTTQFNDSTGYTDTLEIQDATLKPYVIYLGQMLECGNIRDQIVKQVESYGGTLFEPGAYLRSGEWGMVDEALITHVLIDLGMKSPDTLTTSQETIENDWCIKVDEADLKPGDIVTWNHDLHEMGWYVGNGMVWEVWGSILKNNTPQAMRAHRYWVKGIQKPPGITVWRLKELKDCD